jgi:hypothetical protein
MENLWYILGPFGLFYCHWKYFKAIWYVLWPFGIYFPALVFWTKKNLVTLMDTLFCFEVVWIICTCSSRNPSVSIAALYKTLIDFISSLKNFFGVFWA